MSDLTCPHCNKVPKKISDDYEGIKCFYARCDLCDFEWLPIAEENRIDREHRRNLEYENKKLRAELGIAVEALEKSKEDLKRYAKSKCKCDLGPTTPGKLCWSCAIVMRLHYARAKMSRKPLAVVDVGCYTIHTYETDTPLGWRAFQDDFGNNKVNKGTLIVWPKDTE